jgi:hypothetical protein
MRCLYRVGDDEFFAYALTRRDFLLVSDSRLWAHESHDWLVAAHSGELLAHRTRGVYYDVQTGRPLFYEAAEPVPPDPDATRPSRHRFRRPVGS